MVLVTQRQPKWRLDPWELMDWNARRYLMTVTEQYFKENVRWVQSRVSIWEAYKTVIRVLLISHIVRKKWESVKQVEVLEGRLCRWQVENVVQLSAELTHKIAITRDEYRQLVEGEVWAQYRAF